MAGEHRYAAFISYSHADENTAAWLHRRLESYRVPSPLVGQAGPAGPISRRLGKVFRDRADLSAAPDLAEEIRAALAASETLIVLCSPAAARSKYVNEEIRYFKTLGRGARIMAAIIAGEPHAAGKIVAAKTLTAIDECLPRALINRLADDGAVSDAPEPAEPIAADFREDKDEREAAALKLIAGMLDVGLDELVRRERVAARRRRLFAYGLAGVFAALAAVATVQSMVAVTREREAVANEQRALDALGVAALLRAENAYASSQVHEALRYALLAAQATPANAPQAERLLGRVLFEVNESTPLRTGGAGLAAMAYSPDGRTLATGDAVGVVTFWDIATLQRRARWRGHEGAVVDLSFSGSGADLVTVGGDSVRIWRVSDGAPLHLLRAPRAERAAFSPDGRTIAVIWDRCSALSVWGIGAPVTLGLDARRDCYMHIAFSTDGGEVHAVWAETTDRRNMDIWDAASGRYLTTTAARADFAVASRFDRLSSADGRFAATVLDYDRENRFWPGAVVRSAGADAPAARLLGHEDAITALAFAPDGTQIATASEDGSVRVWRGPEGRMRATWSTPEDAVTDVSIDASGAIVSAHASGMVRVRRVRASEPIVIQACEGYIQALALRPGRDEVLVACSSGRASLRRLATGREVRAMAHGANVRRVAFSGNGAMALSASDDGVVKIWNADSGEQQATWTHPEGPTRMRAAVFTPDGAHALTATGEVAWLWSVADGSRSSPLPMPEGVGIWDADISPDGRRIAIGGNRGLVYFFDAETHLQTHATRQGVGLLRFVRFSADGRRVFTATLGGEAYAFDADNGDVMAAISALGRMSSLDVSADDARLVAGNNRGELMLVDASPLTARIEALTAEACRRFLSPHASTVTQAEREADAVLSVLAGARDWDVCALGDASRD